jgi:hypothetical protein
MPPRSSSLLIAAFLLASPALIASADPLPVALPPDATGYAVGNGALLGEDVCPGTYAISVVLSNVTSSQGQWALSFEKHPQAETIPMLYCGQHFEGIVTLLGSFDPQTGGCFGGSGEPDTICLTFVHYDDNTYAYTYDVTDEFHGTSPSLRYHGYVRLVFVDPLSDPLPPAPTVVPEWAPTNATGYGAGGGTVTNDRCPGTYAMEVTLHNRTSSGNYWYLQYDLLKDAVSIAQGTCGTYTGGSILNGTFDPGWGGCFGSYSPPDAARICFTFVEREPTTGALLYDVTIEDRGFSLPYYGTVRVLFADPAVSSP